MSAQGYKIIHDEDYAEDASGNSYLVCKCYGPDDAEVGHVKLAIAGPAEGQGDAVIQITVSGGLVVEGGGPPRIFVTDDDGHAD